MVIKNTEKKTINFDIWFSDNKRLVILKKIYHAWNLVSFGKIKAVAFCPSYCIRLPVEHFIREKPLISLPR